MLYLFCSLPNFIFSYIELVLPLHLVAVTELLQIEITSDFNVVPRMNDKESMLNKDNQEGNFTKQVCNQKAWQR